MIDLEFISIVIGAFYPKTPPRSSGYASMLFKAAGADLPAKG